jgi:hypothetical protein
MFQFVSRQDAVAALKVSASTMKLSIERHLDRRDALDSGESTVCAI